MALPKSSSVQPSLVNYSSSSDSDSENSVPGSSAPAAKRRRVHDRKQSPVPSPAAPAPSSSLPPLPAAFRDLYAFNARVSTKDDPALHGGRKRITPHVEGQWPTHVYLEWYPAIDSTLQTISKLNDRAKALCAAPETSGFQSLLHSDLGAQLPLHVSLSRPVALLTDQRGDFLDALRGTVTRAKIRPFYATFSGLNWVSNYEGTRWFLVLRLHKPTGDELNKLLHASNTILSLFNQPPLYTSRPEKIDTPKTSAKSSSSSHNSSPDLSAHFHISIAWRLTSPSATEVSAINELSLEALSDTQIRFDTVKVKIGNAIENIGLGVKVLADRGFGGV